VGSADAGRGTNGTSGSAVVSGDNAVVTSPYITTASTTTRVCSTAIIAIPLSRGARFFAPRLNVGVKYGTVRESVTIK
jgi:hypothetical protein